MKEPMSLEGYDLLVKEFKFLLEVQKPEVVQEKLVAAAQGDRSENADYHAAKEKLRFIDKRLFFLNEMIQKSQIIDPSTFPHAKVGFGSTVKIVNLDTDEEEVYTLCGVLESEPENGLISIHSPLARALMGRGVNDDFKVQLPHAKKEYEILEIKYINIFSLKKNIRGENEFSFH
ncbi:MAG: transcription elongation factor GreA [Epsilonproteobacteria bacterium]|nr:transcription elongation factor GreA [Campylobacterota bacterium]OIO16666.1 MAG: transcription elongation factor GreA [Helicobacteraceae bacterium CG1_02_36_14]PIP09822.1 MAG: transcription elongation factor GreA [Sulfurimonas sp. CG23_combo_of_CG06-09_8_20_14_all_36_33]PIS24037.1 MAG: transcription elongation factor GreA [Sulfurimonas sp. CG08_land_8_20_14_0_20_36_33]PIU35521.1 MAG: transcription elongation factor GreA [Sulfurimonas sp. CG07_land_8_20_14_0_80_36_56]PIV05442.1 MAG: transcri